MRGQRAGARGRVGACCVALTWWEAAIAMLVGAAVLALTAPALGGGAGESARRAMAAAAMSRVADAQGGYQISVTLLGSGTGSVEDDLGEIACPADCLGQYSEEGQVVTLTATADAGSYFAGWSGGGCSGTGPCEVTIIDSAINVTAAFEQSPQVVVAFGGSGTGVVDFDPEAMQCSSSCARPFAPGTEVTVTPTADAGSYFAGWVLGPCAGMSGPCTFTMSTTNVVLGPVFNTFPSVVIGFGGSGTGVVDFDPEAMQCSSSCSRPFAPGTEVTVTPTADAGSYFVGWFFGPCAGMSGPCTFTMSTTNVVLGPVFNTFPSVVIGFGGSGTGVVDFDPEAMQCSSSCSRPFAPGTEVTVTPTADAGSYFAGWFFGPCAGMSGPCTFTMSTTNVVLGPVFNTFPSVVIGFGGSGTGVVDFDPEAMQCSSSCSRPFAPGTEVTVTPTADAGSYFAGWFFGPCAGMSGPCTFTLEFTDVVIGAVFIAFTEPPVAECRDVTIDATSVCPSFFITPEDVDDGSTDPEIPLGDEITLSLDFSGPFPIGQTMVTLTVTDSAGLSDTCTATVTVLAEDCNTNGVPDTCDVETGFSLDCNLDGVPDECVCFWNNGMAPGLARRQDGEASHEGGGIPDGIRTADDFYLCPGQVHRLTAFTGQMITNSYNQNGVDLRRAKLLIYEDCNGKPVAEPFFDSVVEEIDSEIIAVDNAAGEFELVTYRFDLCDECLWLDGGKSYWVSLIGLTDHVTSDLSYWAKQRPRRNGEDRPIKGLPPLIAEGIPGGGWDDPFDYGPWYPVDDCCIGCVNMAFKLQGYSCKIAWDNGPADLGAGKGGSVSGAAGAFGVARSADQFVLNPCNPNTRVCLIDTYIWTNCIPVQPFLELYDDNPCGPPELPRDPRGGFVTCDACKIIETGEVYVENGVTYKGYILRFTPDWELEPGRTYWLSSGSHKDGAGNFTGKAFFAYRGLCNEGACRTYRITPGHTRTLSPGTPTDWVATTRDFAFRVAVHSPEEMVPEIPDPEDLEEEAGGGGNEGLPAPACAADVDGSGQITVEDIFSFLSAWFAGCP